MSREQAIAELEARWRRTRDPALADLIGELDPVELEAKTLDAATAKVAAADLDDPRVVAAQARILARMPYTSDSSKAFWKVFFEGLSDPRFIAVDPERIVLRPALQRAVRRMLVEAQERIRSSGLAVVEEPDVAALVASVRETFLPTSETAEGLLEAIYAAPDDDAPRLVYADWLTERGDVRGEFIALQIAGEERKAKKLLKGNERAWLGDLDAVIAKKDLVYRRGFLAGCRTVFKSQALVDLHGHDPAWSTLEALVGIAPGHEDPKQAWTNWIGPAFRNLRVLRGIRWAGLEYLRDADFSWRLDDLGVVIGDDASLQTFEQIQTVPNVTVLGVDGYVGVRQLATILAAPAAANVTEIRTLSSNVDLLRDAANAGIERITHSLDGGKLQLCFEGEGLRRLTVTGSGKPSRIAQHGLRNLLYGREPDAVTVIAKRGFPHDEASIRALSG